MQISAPLQKENALLVDSNLTLSIGDIGGCLIRAVIEFILIGYICFSTKVREVRIWSCLLSESEVRQNMHVQRIDLVQPKTTGHGKSALIGYWPMNRLMSGPWPWQGSLVSCTSHLEEHRENSVHLRIVPASLP